MAGLPELLMDEITTPDETAARIDAVNAADVVRVAERLLHGSAFRLAIVGSHDDAAEFEAVIRESM